MLPLAEFRVLDHNAVGLGVSLADLMERAGQAVADELLHRWPKAGSIVICCGPGNNGGDGVVAGRLLYKAGQQVTLVLVGAESSEGLKSQLAREVWGQLPSEVTRFSLPEADKQRLAKILEQADVVVDALLGSGLHGRLREPFATVVEALNGSGKPLLSVDVPTGLGARPMVKPQVTVTFAEAKEGMSQANSGEIVEVDIGFPAAARTRCGPGEAQLLPRPDSQARKGDHGKVVIVGGGPYTGAPILAGLAAYRVGADLVYLALPGRAAAAAEGYAPEFIVAPLEGPWLTPDHLEFIRTLCQKADCVLLGPGLGRAPDTRKAVGELLETLRRPLVLDADGLYAAAAAPQHLLARAAAAPLSGGDSSFTILTPHAGELRRLGRALYKDPQARARIKERQGEALKELAVKLSATLLAKGPIDYITDGQYLKENHTGNPRMAVGGTGDVLAGAVAGLRARGLTGFQAARLGAYLVGAAGDLTLEELGGGFLASELADRIPRALELALRV